MRICLIGGAGWPNYGDELILKGWLSYLVENKRISGITAYVGNKVAAEDFHDKYNNMPNIEFSDDLERIASTITNLSFWEQVVRGYNFITNGGMDKYKHIDFSKIRESDVIHLHGGGYLNKLWPQRGFFLGLAAAFNREYNVKLYATGIGLGPVDTVPAHLTITIHEIFDRFEFFEVRDHEHFRFLAKDNSLNNVLYGLDDCYLIDLNDNFVKNSKRKTLYLSFIEYNLEKFSSAYWSKISKLADSFDDIIFVESSPKQDKNVFNFLKSQISEIKLLQVKDCVYGHVNVGNDDVVICSRFHVHYMFSRMGLRGFYNQDSKYYDVKHYSIIDRGSKFKLANQPSDLILDDKGICFLSNIEVENRNIKLSLADKIYN